MLDNIALIECHLMYTKTQIKLQFQFFAGQCSSLVGPNADQIKSGGDFNDNLHEVLGGNTCTSVGQYISKGGWVGSL